MPPRSVRPALPLGDVLRRALVAGVAGTAAMTVSTRLEKAWRGEIGHPVNPDASYHVATAVGTVLHRPPRSDRERTAYFLLAHWGYGSAVALSYPLLRRRPPATPTPAGQRRPDARTAGWLWLGCQAMAMTLFPTLGGTPPPWRWRRDVVASSVVHHVVYVVTVAGVERALRPPTR